MPPDRRLYAAHVYRPLDVTAMKHAAEFFIGEHDFAAFTANPNRKVETTVRRITFFTVRRSGRAICFRVRGNGFLYRQVRSMGRLPVCAWAKARKNRRPCASCCTSARHARHAFRRRRRRDFFCGRSGMQRTGGCRRGVNMTSENETVAGKHRRDAG